MRISTLLSTLILSITFSFNAGAQSLALHDYLKNFQQDRSETKSKARFRPKSIDRDGDFLQRVDHFDPNNRSFFSQRYFINSEFANGPQAPVLLVICGEHTCQGASSLPTVNRLAQSMKAHLVALEHRYYGKSQPFPTLTAQNLKFLSTAQALADLNAFQDFAINQFSLKGFWIAIGGSYAGSLASFYRLKYPDRVVGALASSAPIFAKADFFEYDQHTASVAGPECRAAVLEAVAEVETRLADPRRRDGVKALFGATEIREDADFLYVLADIVSIAVQYGFDNQLCPAVIFGRSQNRLLDSFAEVGLNLLRRFELTPISISFQGAESENPDDYLSFAGMRAWMYQSCTEYGFFQVPSPDLARTIRSRVLTLDYHQSVCARLFGLTDPVNTEKTNASFFDDFSGRKNLNILFTNGTNDPWTLLSVTPNQVGPFVENDSGVDLVLIEGAAHCDDLGVRRSGELARARDRFEPTLQRWLLSKVPAKPRRQMRITRRNSSQE